MKLPTPSFRLPTPERPPILPTIDAHKVIYFSPQAGGKGWCYWNTAKQMFVKIYNYPKRLYNQATRRDYAKLLSKLKKRR